MLTGSLDTDNRSQVMAQGISAKAPAVAVHVNWLLWLCAIALCAGLVMGAGQLRSLFNTRSTVSDVLLSDLSVEVIPRAQMKHGYVVTPDAPGYDVASVKAEVFQTRSFIFLLRGNNVPADAELLLTVWCEDGRRYITGSYRATKADLDKSTLFAVPLVFLPETTDPRIWRIGMDVRVVYRGMARDLGTLTVLPKTVNVP